MAKFETTQTGTHRTFRTTLTYSDGLGDFTTAASVKFIMRASSATALGAALIDATATIIDKTLDTQMVVQYQFTSAQLLNLGTYYAKWEVTFADGRTDFFPSGNKFDTVLVGDDLRSGA